MMLSVLWGGCAGVVGVAAATIGGGTTVVLLMSLLFPVVELRCSDVLVETVVPTFGSGTDDDDDCSSPCGSSCNGCNGSC